MIDNSSIQKPSVTIVVPIYNVSSYLEQCVDSIINQTFKEIEIILVNDDSPDPEDHRICQAYERKFSNVVYIKHEQNRGLGGARNTGIKHANGEYITFTDSDDWLEPTMIEKLHKAAKEKNACIAQCYFKDHYQDSNKIKLRKVKQFRKFPDRMNAINVLAWNKIFKKSLYKENNVFFPEKIASEDVATMTRLLYFVNRVVLVKEPLYNYRANRIGAITSDFRKLLMDLPIVFQIIKDFLVSIDRFEKDRIYFELRVLKSLTHHLKRFHHDNRMNDTAKDALIREHLAKSTAFLKGSGSLKTDNLHDAIVSLNRYKYMMRSKAVLGLISRL